MPGDIKPFDKIGCKKCGRGQWEVLTNGDAFRAQCTQCGHNVALSKVMLTESKDFNSFDMRFFT